MYIDTRSLKKNFEGYLGLPVYKSYNEIHEKYLELKLAKTIV